MEPAELISEEWSSLSGLYTADEADFMNHFLGNCSLPQQLYTNSHESTTVTVTKNSNFAAQLPTSTSDTSNNFFPTKTCLNNTSNFAYISMGLSLGDSKCTAQGIQNTDEQVLDAHNNFQAQKEHEILVSEPEEDKTRTTEKLGKRSRSYNEVPKNKRNVKCRKNMMRSGSISTEENACPGSQDQTLNSYCSEDDDSNSSTALKLSGKSKSSRGPATDPQSLYARKRRERINERLRILQNLVPNGTKVDISTMLEEAVQYVKFLQLQIKLLSSDDMWMYSPIAYNGMNIGLELGITPTKDIDGIAIKENSQNTLV